MDRMSNETRAPVMAGEDYETDVQKKSFVRCRSATIGTTICPTGVVYYFYPLSQPTINI